MGDIRAYAADGLFTGETWLPGHAVIVLDGVIMGLAPTHELPSDVSLTQYPSCIMAPAFIDIQIYGASQKLFSAFPEPSSLGLLVNHNRRGGTALCLPTIATNTRDIVYRGIDAIRTYWNSGGTGIFGLHLEGPWINPDRRGAHIESLIHEPSVAEVQELLAYGNGVIRMITIAPEKCSREVIELIRSNGIVLSAGHSNATFEEATDSFERGIGTVTLLYNAMSPLHHRLPGLTGAAMLHGSVMASIIPDGHHVDFAAIRIAKQLMKDRLFVITDAVTETNDGPYAHVRAGDKFESGGILSGSALTMNAAVRNLVLQAGISMDEALRMCSLYPAKVLRTDGRMGKLAQGYDASMVILDKDFTVVAMIG